MSDLVERLCRLFCEAEGIDPDAPPKAGKPAPAWKYESDYAREAIREVLAELREPSEAMVAAYWGYPMPEHVSDGMREEVRANTRLVLDAFAREHGLQMPAPPRQTPQEGRSDDGTASGASDAENAPGGPGGPLPAHSTPEGHAA